MMLLIPTQARCFFSSSEAIQLCPHALNSDDMGIATKTVGKVPRNAVYAIFCKRGQTAVHLLKRQIVH